MSTPRGRKPVNYDIGEAIPAALREAYERGVAEGLRRTRANPAPQEPPTHLGCWPVRCPHCGLDEASTNEPPHCWWDHDGNCSECGAHPFTATPEEMRAQSGMLPSKSPAESPSADEDPTGGDDGWSGTEPTPRACLGLSAPKDTLLLEKYRDLRGTMRHLANDFHGVTDTVAMHMQTRARECMARTHLVPTSAPPDGSESTVTRRSNLRKEIRRLRGRLAVADSDAEDSQRESDDLRATLAMLQGELEEMRRERDIYKGRDATNTGLIRMKDSALTAERAARKEALQRGMDAGDKERDRLREQLDAAEAARKQAEHDLDYWKSRAESDKAKLAEARARSDARKKERDEAAVARDAHFSRAVALQRALGDAEHTLSVLSEPETCEENGCHQWVRGTARAGAKSARLALSAHEDPPVPVPGMTEDEAQRIAATMARVWPHSLGDAVRALNESGLPFRFSTSMAPSPGHGHIVHVEAVTSTSEEGQ